MVLVVGYTTHLVHLCTHFVVVDSRCTKSKFIELVGFTKRVITQRTNITLCSFEHSVVVGIQTLTTTFVHTNLNNSIQVHE